MASTTVGDYLLTRLREWEVDTVFGFPGDGIKRFAGGLGARRRSPKVRADAP